MLRTFIALSLLAAAAGAADNPETLTERSQSAARAVLDRAVEANGGAEALQAVNVVRLQLEGELWPRLQMPTVEPPYEAGWQSETLLVDLDNNRLLLEQRTRNAGFEGHNTITITAGQGTNYDHRARTATPIPAAQATQQQFVQYYRRLPNLLLRQALERANTLRHLGADSFDGRAHEVITFVMPDTQQVALYIDAKNGLISKYELIYVDSLTGEEASEIIFGDYAMVGKYQVPRSWRNQQAGDRASDQKMRAEINPAVTDDSFRVSADGYAQVAPVPTTLEQKVEQLAEGVYVIQNVAGHNQNTLAVGFRDHVALALTHHHGDHIGGLRSFIAEGATVITTPGNRQVVERMAAARQNDRLGKNPRAPQFLTVENGRRVLSDGSRTLELIDIGPNPHAREMVVAYLPGERVLFQGNLFFVPNNDAPFGPPQAPTMAFARKLKELGLAVDRIASVHGSTATIGQFEQAITTAP